MLEKLSEKVVQCHRRAREAREKAERATEFGARRDYQNLERRWLLLADSYQLTQRVADFSSEVKKRIAVFRPSDTPDTRTDITDAWPQTPPLGHRSNDQHRSAHRRHLAAQEHPRR